MFKIASITELTALTRFPTFYSSLRRLLKSQVQFTLDWHFHIDLQDLLCYFSEEKKCNIHLGISLSQMSPRVCIVVWSQFIS